MLDTSLTLLATLAALTANERFVFLLSDIAASAYGRDFLIESENGQRLVDTFISFVSQAPLKKSARIKR